jgi:peptide/nickel transport system substrate-binding protein
MPSHIRAELRAMITASALAVLVITSCTSTAPTPGPSGQSQPAALWSDKTFVAVYPSLPADIDPHGKLYTGASESVMRTFYESLVYYNPTSRKIEGVLATSWEATPDAKTFTFKLRDGVKFHDGSQLSAEAVKLSLERMVDQGGARLQFLRNLERVEAVDNLTVRVHLKTGSAVFLGQVPELPIASAEALKAHFKDQWFINHEAGSGPYTLEASDYQPGARSVSYKPFGDYWRGWGPNGFATIQPSGAKHLGRIEIRVAPEAATQRLLVESGEAHFMTLFPISYMTELKDSARVDPTWFPAQKIVIMPLNVAHGPLTDIRLRRMVSLAFPYEDHIRNYYQGHAVRAAGPVNPSLMEDPSLKPVQQDLARAKALLSEAGFGPGQLTLTGVSNAGEDEVRQVMVVLQDALRQIGVTLKLTEMPFANITQAVASGATNTPDIMILGNSPKGADPGVAVLQQFFYSKNKGQPYNWGHYSNPTVDKLLEDGQQTLNESQRLEIYRQAQRAAVEDVPALYIAFPDRWNLLAKSVGGYWLYPLGPDRLPWYDMYWK